MSTYSPSAWRCRRPGSRRPRSPRRRPRPRRRTMDARAVPRGARIAKSPGAELEPALPLPRRRRPRPRGVERRCVLVAVDARLGVAAPRGSSTSNCAPTRVIAGRSPSPASRRWPRRRCARTRRGRPRACGHLDRPRAQRATRVLPRGGHRPAGANRRRRRRATRADRRRTSPAPARPDRPARALARAGRRVGGDGTPPRPGNAPRGARRRRRRRSPRSPTRSRPRARRSGSRAGSSRRASGSARRARTLRELLADAARRVDVRVLAWAGAPLPLFQPAPPRGPTTMRDALARGTRVRVALDDRERPLHCHHEKLVIVDGEVAFVGGIDLTSLGGDRLDSSEHPARGAARLARRRRAAARARGRGRRRALPAPLARGDGRAAAARPVAGPPRGDVEAAGRAHGPGADLRRGSRAASSGSSSRTCGRSARRGGSSTSRTSSSGRQRSSPCSRRSCAARRTTASGSSSCSRRSRTTATTTRADSSAVLASRRRRRRAASSPARSSSAATEPHARVRAREGRHRRRPLADGRLREPERALALQRHGDERRLARSRRSPARRGCGCGASISSATPPSSTATRRSRRRALAPDGGRATRRAPRRGAGSRPARRAAGRLAAARRDPRGR